VSAIPLSYLVVEDHGFQRWLITKLLEDLGAKAVYSVGDGRAALEVLERLGQSIDVVVSDLDMPGMDGMELMRRMAEQGHRAALLILSAHASPVLATVRNMAREYGIDVLAAVQKPLTAAKFQAVLASRDPATRAENDGAAAFTARELEAGLHGNEFEAFFQAKVEMRSGRVCGAEALTRWRRPYRGIVSPGAFMATLESSGLTETLNRKMARMAMNNCRDWRDSGFELAVSINLSAHSLSDVGLADEMRELAGDVGIEPRLITFEITESATAKHLARKLENLSRLRINGFGLSIDDFGTGYSSMQRLSRIPFTELKIDQSFVKSVVADAACRAVVESSIDLARKLGITAVAEGVESHEHWEALQALGCPVAQGYYIARPLEADGFLAWLRMRKGNCRAEGGQSAN
jgi:EAL domain-containing protein (putative c-di-GMP-specific phosphodiesterase class I)